MDSRALKGHRETVVLLVHLDREVQLVLPDSRVPGVRRAQRVSPENWVILAALDQLDQPVYSALPEIPARLEIPELSVIPVTKVPLGCRDLKD